MTTVLTFLGTSSGVPTLRRNVSGLAVRTGPGRAWLLVDCGEATQHRLQRSPHRLHDLQAVFITHSHGDHIYGLPGLLASAGMQGRQAPLALVAPRAVLRWLEASPDLYLPYAVHGLAWDESADGACVWRSDGEHGQNQEGPTVTVTHHALRHRVPSVAYALHLGWRRVRLDGAALRARGVPAGPLWGALQAGRDILWQGQTLSSASVRRVEEQTQTLVIGGDNAEPGLLQAVCADAQLLVHEATYTRAVLKQVGPQYQHSCAEDVARMAARCGVPNLILTHFSPRLDADMVAVREEAQEHYSGRLELAEDLVSYVLERDGRLRRGSANTEDADSSLPDS